MLTISEASMNAFAHQARGRLLQRIDSWLCSELPHWAAMPREARGAQLAAILDRAERAGMKSERDYAVFAWICAMLGDRWPERLQGGDLPRVLDDPAFSPEAKLMHLDEVLGLTAGRRAGVPA